MDVIAERRLIAIFPNAGPISVHLRIGRPAAHKEEGWVCPVQAQGLRLWQGPAKISGEDSWQALNLALLFLRRMLIAEAERGAEFHYEDGETPIRAQELFDGIGLDCD
jgi:uncharacterized protein DUF6968